MLASKSNYESEINFHLDQIKTALSQNYQTKAETNSNFKKLQQKINGLFKMHSNNLVDLSTIRQKSNTRASNIQKTSSMTGGTSNDNNELGLYVIKQGYNYKGNANSYNTSQVNIPSIGGIGNQSTLFEDSFDNINKTATLNLRGSQDMHHQNAYSQKMKANLNNSNYSSIVSITM